VTSFAEFPEIPSCRDSQLHTARLEYLKFTEFALHSREQDVVANALEDLT